MAKVSVTVQQNHYGSIELEVPDSIFTLSSRAQKLRIFKLANQALLEDASIVKWYPNSERINVNVGFFRTDT